MLGQPMLDRSKLCTGTTCNYYNVPGFFVIAVPFRLPALPTGAGDRWQITGYVVVEVHTLCLNVLYNNIFFSVLCN